MVTKVIINYLVIDNTKIIDSFESSDLCTRNTIIKVSFVTYWVSISKSPNANSSNANNAFNVNNNGHVNNNNAYNGNGVRPVW